MTGNCERYESLLSGWLDGDFDPSDRLEILDHMVRCAACRGFYLEARALDGLVAAVRPPAAAEPLPTALWKRIEAEAGRTAPIRFGPRRIPGWALRAAAAAILAAGLALFLWGGDPPARVREADIQVLLEEDGDAMTEDRFVELTTEVLRADRRFHVAMLEVMEQVIDDTGGSEGSVNEVRRSREVERNGDDEGEDRSDDRGLA